MPHLLSESPGLLGDNTRLTCQQCSRRWQQGLWKDVLRRVSSLITGSSNQASFYSLTSTVRTRLQLELPFSISRD